MWPLVPVPGESLLGFASRTAHHNLLPSGYTILRRAGHSDLQRSYATLMGDVDVGTIARALGVDLQEVLSRRVPAADAPGFVLLNGVEVRKEDIVTHHRRFGPSRLAHDGLHNASSMVKTLPFCPTTWEYLRDTCMTCGRLQGWRGARELRRCDECGERLATQQMEEVAEHLRPGLATVAGLLDADPATRQAALACLPPALSHLSGGEAFELTLTMLYIEHPELNIHRPVVIDADDQRAFTQALADTASQLPEFPGALLDNFTSSLASGKRMASSSHKRFFRAIAGKLRTGDHPAVTAAMTEAVSEVPGADHPSVAGYYDAAEAALGRSSRLIKSARANGVFINRLVYTRARFRLGFDRQELDELNAVHLDRLGVEMVALGMALPTYAIPQLAEHDLLSVHSHAWWIDQFGMDQTTKAAAATLRKRLRSAASPPGSVDDPIQLSWAMRAFGGGPKPWGAALHSLIEGDVPFTLTGPEKANYIWISRADIDRCCLRTQGAGLAEYSQRDALDILNCGGRFARRLATLARTGLGRTAWRLTAEDLMPIATGCVTAAELSARTGLHANVVAKKLRAKTVPETLIGWDREAAETELSTLLAKGIGGRLVATSECA
jgi:hypothetical protein